MIFHIWYEFPGNFKLVFLGTLENIFSVPPVEVCPAPCMKKKGKAR